MPQEIAKSLLNGELPPDLEPPETIAALAQEQGLLEMMRWVVAHLGEDPDKRLDVPNEGCRELLRWARSEPKQFWPIFARYDTKAKEQTVHIKKFEDDQRRHFVLLDRVLANWEQKQAALQSIPTPAT